MIWAGGTANEGRSVGYIKAILLAIVEGATEFIPVSSTGHLIIVDDYIKLSTDPAFSNAFMVIIQLPAVLAVVAYFWTEIWPFQRDSHERNARLMLWARVVVAFLPAAVLGALFDDTIEAYLFNSITVAAALVVGGLLLLIIERNRPATRLLTVFEIGFATAFFIGLFQCVAMIPGTSRSAATIIGAMLLGATRPAAAEFSFILAIPTMVGATAYKLLKNGFDFSAYEWSILVVGCATSFLVAYSVVAMFMNYIQRRDFKPFGYYRIVLGIVVLLQFFASSGKQ